MAEEFAIKGLNDVMKRIRTLPRKLQRSALRKAVRKGANVVRKAVVARARRIDDPATSERIWKNVSVQGSARQSRRAGGVVMRVGIRGGAKKGGGDESNPGGDTWYWRFKELGTSRTRAEPFMQPAMAESVEPATAEIARSLNEEIDKVIAQGL